MSNPQIDFLVRCKALGLENGKLSDWLDEIEALRAENEALKQQVEQGKRDAVPEWISVDDRLPSEQETCDGRVSALDVDGVAVIGVSCGSNILTANGKATRWMPLPAAPKQEK